MAAAAATTADFLVGATIGEGAYGKVVHAIHKTTGKYVAIKVMTKQSIQKDPALMTVAMKERRLLSDFQESEHIVSLWASFHDSECLYFVMECLAGGDLAHAIRSGLHDPEQWSATIPNYSRQLVSALEFIHSRAVIHADLKPENVLLTTTGKLKLADFGAAIELSSGAADDKSPAVSEEQMRYIGTADYASPEVIRGEAALLPSAAVDLWSLGCVLYAMWEGASPFHDESDALAIQRIMRYCAAADEERQRLQTDNMPDDWMTLIQGLLTPEPSERVGMNDFHLVYRSIRKSPCLLRTACSEEEDEVHFRAPEPSWWVETQNSDKRDGTEGWSVFLL
jgi:3-phosphoinositide dependent protein kinase-1